MRSRITRSFYGDPGHGWLKVPYSDLEFLGIQNRITHCSYQRISKNGEKFVFLEEDCDFSTYLDALKSHNIILNLHQNITDSPSRIRGYDSYSC